ncbi:hypothetical protein KAU40_01760 [Candidatus Parcubacteria bacterium]|nr:hypothetical protein [Candidatus Parcubacteria bacterium]
MPNFKLFGYREEKSRDLEKKIKKIFQKSPDREEMVVTTIPSTVKRLKDNSNAPYIEIADSDSGKGKRLLKKLSQALNEDMELTPIDVFVPADEKFVK